MTLHGVDVASFQGQPRQWSGAAGRISFAAVKITELEPGGSRYVNPDAAADWEWLASKGHSRIAYLFGHPSTSPTASVDLFISELDKLGVRDTDAICLDHEVNDGLGPATVARWARAVQASLHAHYDRRPLLYTFLSFARAGNCAGLGSYPLWIADPSSPAGHPTVPAPWSKWVIHQYAISGDIDRDVADFATQAAMHAALGKPRPAPKPPAPTTEDDMPQLLLTGQATPIRWCEGRPCTQLLLSVAHGAPVQSLTVYVHDKDGTYDAKVAVSWGKPGVLHFRHPGKVKEVSVTPTADGTPVSFLIV